MVMATSAAGVSSNLPGDGTPAAASPAGVPECRLRRRRRRLSPPPAAAPASGGSGDAGPSRRRSPSQQTSSSSEDNAAYTAEEEEDTEEEYGEEEAGRRAVMPPLGLALPAPVRQQQELQQQGGGAAVWPVAFGAMELAGRMREMEDTVSVHPGFYTWVDGTPMHFFAVFDGHGGTHVSALCRNQMHLLVAEELAQEGARFLHRRRQHTHHAAPGSAAWDAAGESDAAWRAALHRAFARVDALTDLACACGAATVPPCACPLSSAAPAVVGSTAVVALLAGARIVVANCGDSRAVLCRGPAGAPPVPLSVDHKPNRPDERARIESVGGQVIFNNGYRVRGILAMSRALGDKFLRPEVISEPEITVTQRTEADQCLILASDGMWDAMSNETACAVARQCLEDGGNYPPPGAVRNTPGAVGPNPEHRCQVTAAILARLALGRGSLDNVSIVIVDLRNRAGP